MRSIILFFAFILTISTLSSQKDNPLFLGDNFLNQIQIKVLLQNEITKNDFEFPSEDKWIKDSTYFYQYSETAYKFLRSKSVSLSINNKGDILEKRYFDYDTLTMNWSLSHQRSYDRVIPNQVTITYKTWNDSNKELINRIKYVVKYNSSNQIIEYLRLSWDSNISKWINSYKVSYSYYPDGNYKLDTAFRWDKNKSIWEKSIKYSYTKNGFGVLTDLLVQEWDFDMTSWHNLEFYEYNWNKEKTEKITLISRWDKDNQKWEIPSLRNSDKFNSDEKMISSLGEYLEKTIWIISSKTEYSYDKEGNNDSYKRSFFDENAKFEFGTLDQYFWSQFVITNIFEIDKSIQVFPNPTMDRIIISGDEIESGLSVQIFNQNGQIVSLVKNTSIIDMSSLNSGSYFMHLRSKTGYKVIQVVKK